MSDTRQTAIFRVEGVLVRRTARASAAWMAAQQRSMGQRLLALGAIALSAPLASPGGDATLATRLAWRALEGCSEDRLVVLGEDWWSQQIQNHWNTAGLELLMRCREQGMRIVLLSDHPQVAIGPIREAVGADVLICNRLEIVHGEATGKLIDPVFTGYADGSWIRQLARQHGFDPDTCFAYGANASDATLLSGAARPCTVNPDRVLRRLAATFDWPVVES